MWRKAWAGTTKREAVSQTMSWPLAESRQRHGDFYCAYLDVPIKKKAVNKEEALQEGCFYGDMQR